MIATLRICMKAWLLRWCGAHIGGMCPDCEGNSRSTARFCHASQKIHGFSASVGLKLRSARRPFLRSAVFRQRNELGFVDHAAETAGLPVGLRRLDPIQPGGDEVPPDVP